MIDFSSGVGGEITTFFRGLTSRRDHRALAAAGAILSFFLATKFSLLLWHLTVKRSRPLSDVPADGIFYLFGGDLLIALAVACCGFALHQVDALGGAGARLAGRAARGVMYATLVLFCVVSFQVARIYGEPLDVEMLRSGDNLMVLRHSIWAYVGPMPIVLTLYGFLCVPLLGRPLAAWLERRQWLRERWKLWTTVALTCGCVAGLQKLRLGGIDTFGVKDNAVIFFVKEYRPEYRPIDGPRIMHEMEARRGDLLQRTQSPASLAVPGGTLPRDFAYSGSASGFNVIVVQMESTGSIHVNRQSAPNLMALADQGLSFQRHSTVATQTLRATCGIYYSDYLPDLGTTPRLVYGGRMPQPALAEVLKSAGYRTGVFHTGFLDYYDIRYLFEGKGMETLVGAREMVQAGAPLAYSAGVHEERTVEEMAGWIRRHKDEKFFAVYLTECPHHPYVSMAQEKPFPDDTWLHRYQNSLHYTDQAVGKLIEFLRAEQLLEKTLVVVVGDHGETVSSYPVGHGLRVSVEETRTPWILANPALFPAPVTSRLATSHLDVAPTLVQMLGLTPPAEWLGRNVLAAQIPAVMQFVLVSHIRRIGLIDNGLMYVREREAERSQLYEIGETELVPLPAGDPRWALASLYRGETDWYTDWSVWRHLRRAKTGHCRDLVRKGAPATVQPARAAADVIPSVMRHDP